MIDPHLDTVTASCDPTLWCGCSSINTRSPPQLSGDKERPANHTGAGGSSRCWRTPATRPHALRGTEVVAANPSLPSWGDRGGALPTPLLELNSDPCFCTFCAVAVSNTSLVCLVLPILTVKRCLTMMLSGWAPLKSTVGRTGLYQRVSSAYYDNSSGI